MNHTHNDADALAERAWAWLVEVQKDRALSVSALRTATLIAQELLAGADALDVAHVRSYLADRGCQLDRDVQALVRGQHLGWRADGDGTARATLKICGRSVRRAGVA